MDLSRGGTIADPIHGYVYFTGLERAILSHRIAQRLRYISQNGLAHLVFPEMRTSRFSHSLGTMHLSSAFLTSCLRNTAERTREQLASGIANAVREAVVIADVRRAAVSFGSPNLYAAHHVRADMSPEITLAEQSLRLAALFHDLGHLPFSHDFENGLEELFRMLNGEERDKLRPLIEQRPGEGKIHERIGHELALLLLKELFPQVRKTDQGEAALITFELAYKILEAAGPPTQNASGYALAWLHSLIDGDLDADRCDYILRDARNYGFEFASYDATRLLDNLAVADDGSSFFTVIRPPGLSALESFFVARYRSYQYGVRHHKVAQVGAALRHSIGRILAAGTAANFLNDLVQIVTGHGQGSLGRFALYDDIWWMSVMKRQCEADDDQWLRLVCWREPGPISVWKK